MHEYQKRLDKALAKGIIDAGTMSHVEVGHDSYCGVYSSEECNCDPDITIKTEGKAGVFVVLRNGQVKRKKEH